MESQQATPNEAPSAPPPNEAPTPNEASAAPFLPMEEVIAEKISRSQMMADAVKFLEGLLEITRAGELTAFAGAVSTSHGMSGSFSFFDGGASGATRLATIGALEVAKLSLTK